MGVKINKFQLNALIFGLVILIFRLRIDFGIITFLMGALLGPLILELDYFCQVFLVQPDLPVAQEAKSLMKTKKYQEMFWIVLSRKNEIKELTFHTIFFQAIFTFFSIFVVTSTNSMLGKGIVLSLLLTLLTKQYYEIRQAGSLSKLWFERINFNLSVKGQKIYVGIQALLLLICAFFCI